MSKNSLNGICDNELVERVKNNNDGDAFVEICNRYENVFYKICQKYSVALTISGVNPQDVFDEKEHIIFHCINTFKPDKAKLSTWIGNYARYLCLNTLNSRKFILPATDEEVYKHIENSQVSHDYNTPKIKPEDFNYILNIINQLKDKRVGEVFKYRYFSDKKMVWANIAKKMNISTQTAINLHNKGIGMIRKKIKSENISDVV